MNAPLNAVGVRFLALAKEDAKQVFSKKEPQELRDFLESLWSDEKRGTQNFDPKQSVAEYQRELESKIALENAQESPLLRGGRLLPSLEGAEVFLIRPDLVGPLAGSLPEEAPLRKFLALAAEVQSAVVILYS